MSSTIAINLGTILIHVCLNYDHKSPECLIFNRKKITRRHLFWSVQCKPICTGNISQSGFNKCCFVQCIVFLFHLIRGNPLLFKCKAIVFFNVLFNHGFDYEDYYDIFFLHKYCMPNMHQHMRSLQEFLRNISNMQSCSDLKILNMYRKIFHLFQVSSCPNMKVD